MPIIPQGSPPFSLTVADWQKIGIGAVLSVGGALAAYVTTQVMPQLKDHIANDVGLLIYTALAALLPVLINIARKFFGDTRLLVIGFMLLCLGCSARPSVAAPVVSVSAPAAKSSGDATSAVLIVTRAGSYDLTVDANGTPTLALSPKQYSRVIDLTGGVPVPNPTPTPDPTPTPTPSPLTERGKLIYAAAMAVTGDTNRAATAQGLAVLYREIAKQVTNGTVKDVMLLDVAQSMGTNIILTQQKDATQWKPYQAVFVTQWTAAKFRGVADCGALLNESADALDASAPAKAIDPAFWQFLLQLIQVILALLKPTP